MKIIWNEELSAGSKVTLLRLIDKYPDGFGWKEIKKVTTSHSMAQRHFKELRETGWIEEDYRGFWTPKIRKSEGNPKAKK